MRLTTTYGPEAVWIGPPYRFGNGMLMLCVAKHAGDPRSLPASESIDEQPVLVVPIDESGGPEIASICIVSCYRWLLAQLVDPGDVTLMADHHLADALARAAERLQLSGDPAPHRVNLAFSALPPRAALL